MFGITLVVLIAGASGGPGWDAAAGHAVLAARLEHTAAAPLYGVVASAFAQLPVGEVGFRLALLSAVLGATTLAGIARAVAALLPRDPLAGGIGIAVLVLAPPFRDAAATASPSMLAACGTVWAVVGVLDHGRARARASTVSSRTGVAHAAFALAMVAVVVGSAPWLGVGLGVIVFAALARAGVARDLLAGGAAAIAVTILVWWFAAIGSWPPLAPSLSAMVATTGRGAAAVVVGAGLLGAAFGAATGLPRAGTLALVIGAVLVHAIAVDPASAPVLATLAIAVAILPSAVVRVLPETRRELVVAVAGAPLIIVALLAGASLGAEDPGDDPARLATDVIGELPPGPGVIVARSGTTWTAVHYAQVVAGARPDLRLVPPTTATIADAVVADALRADQIAGADVSAFGRLEPTRARPRGRGFQLQGTTEARAFMPPPPARYASTIGAQQAALLALGRARYEARAGRLDAAARAAGLTDRFRAADLALLATASLTRTRPALFAFVVGLEARPAGRWLLDLFGDDLAWVAGLELPALPAEAALGRRLHALWRQLLTGTIERDDPQLSALGPGAVAATAEMLAALGR